MRRRPPQARSLAGLALAGAVAVAAAATALAAVSPPVVVDDRRRDTSGALDLQRVALSRAADGRLRAVVTFTGRVTPRTLLASAGPPGSVCVRIWTAVDADPKAMRPDRLVCVTARSRDDLRAGVFEQDGPGLPERVATASVATTSTGRSMIIRFAQSALGMPARVRFAIESTRPGCERVTCIDTAPDAGATRVFRLR